MSRILSISPFWDKYNWVISAWGKKIKVVTWMLRCIIWITAWSTYGRSVAMWWTIILALGSVIKKTQDESYKSSLGSTARLSHILWLAACLLWWSAMLRDQIIFVAFHELSRICHTQYHRMKIYLAHLTIEHSYWWLPIASIMIHSIFLQRWKRLLFLQYKYLYLFMNKYSVITHS